MKIQKKKHTHTHTWIYVYLPFFYIVAKWNVLSSCWSRNDFCVESWKDSWWPDISRKKKIQYLCVCCLLFHLYKFYKSLCWCLCLLVCNIGKQLLPRIRDHCGSTIFFGFEPQNFFYSFLSSSFDCRPRWEI